tara:strand:+ start:6835 stop:7578 length:744 start_codon:yes stop_codon:yes gene_type:complete
MRLDINSDGFVQLTNKLEKLHRSALPSAIRGTLNGLAFDVKKDTLLKSSGREFTQRKKTFFKATSKVEKANGFNVQSMKSKVGFPDKGNNQAIQDLEQQEHGGNIGGRKYIPIEYGRVSKSRSKGVKSRNRLSKIGIGNIVKASDMSGKTQGHRFTQAVAKAGKGGFVQAKLKNKNKTIVWRVDTLQSSLKTKKLSNKLTAVYIVNDSGKVKVKGTSFMEKASVKSAKKAFDIYKLNAERQIQRLNK